MTPSQRKHKVKQLFDRSKDLTSDNRWYRKQLQRYVLEPVLDDSQDITTKPLTRYTKVVKATISSHQAGRFAGQLELRWLAKQLHLTVNQCLSDGTELKPKQVVAKLQGPVRTMFAVERTLLNVLQRMSGIATKTETIVQLVGKRVAIAATRKTLLGGLDKRAVAIGGGYTHRLGLHDGVMIKDNHISVLANFDTLKEIYYRAKVSREIEISSVYQLKHFLNLGLDYDVVMFDNFTPLKIKRAIKLIKAAGAYGRYIFEASGGITKDTIKQYANTGVDIISLGSLTHSVRALDFSMDIYA